jgi:soluble lytic murein transglycosylase-like protein
MRESSGRQNAYNASSACAGLLQLHPGWYRGHWGVPAGDPFDPEYNLRTGRIIWGRCGWSPWAATYY